jgi:hypothetical protein
MIDLDHVSFGTHDALATGKRLRRDYGATAVFGEALPEFRYLALYLGTAEHGGFLELLDPNGPGFMTKFLDRFGEAPHHLHHSPPGHRLRDPTRADPAQLSRAERTTRNERARP